MGSAKDKGTGKEQNIVIQSSGGLSDADIERMDQEAEENQEADQKRRESMEARNEADQLIYSTEKSLTEHGDKLEPADKDEITQHIADVKAAIETEDAEQIKKAVEILQQGAMKIGEAMYKGTG